MKKIIAAFALIVLAAGAVFAQLSFSGKAYAGIQLDLPDRVGRKDINGDRINEVYSAQHRDKGAPRFDFAAAAVQENYGAKLDTTFAVTGSNPMTLNGIFGWVNFFDNSLKLSMGKLSDAAWVTSLDNEYTLDKVTGFRLEWNTPLEGLNVGAAFDVEGGTSGLGQGNYDNPTEQLFKQTIFGANYVHPLFNTVVAYDLGSNTQVIWGFNFTGLDFLTTAGLELKAANLALWDKMGTLALSEKVEWQIIQRVSVSLQADQAFSGVKDAPYDLTFTPGCSYRATREITAFLEGSLKVPVNSDGPATPDFSLKPSVELALKGPAVFYAEYELSVAEFKHDIHRFGFGVTIKAF
jgi:hypothetical protein